ncbi:MAG: hypothetical protein M1839_008389 [Geoglossum umbratile]|nr:MAG: hypothetical protein M1839_008389 [Geoglossum umbratile]
MEDKSDDKRAVKSLEELEAPPGQCGDGAATPPLQEKPGGTGERRVFIVTVPVKDIGPARKAMIKLVSWAVGSPLTWAMHWAICVDDTYFELQRPGGLGKPYLAATTWSEGKRKEIITTCPMGSTILTNEEITIESQAYFANNRMYYDVFSNNCQLFVKFSLKKIAPPESPTPMTPEFDDTISLMLLLAIQLVSIPFMTVYLRWLRWRGCDQYNLQVYAALHSLFVGLTGSTALMTLSQSYYFIAATVYARENVIVATLASLQSAIFGIGLFFSMPISIFPRAKQRRDGTWVVSAIMLQNNEESLDSEVAIKKAFPLLAALLGGCVGLAIWAYIMVPFLSFRCFKAVRERISFRGPGRFVESLWELLTMPLLEFDSDNIKKDDANDDTAENEDSKVKGD